MIGVLRPNIGRKLQIKVNGDIYLRYPIKTHIISSKDDLFDVIKKYASKFLQKGDMLVVSERIVAITQGRSFLLKDITPSFWAKFLSKFVTKHPGGIGLKSPWTMQLAIQEAGLGRIIFAGLISAITKPLGLKGLFYRLAGHDVNAIDGPCDYTLSPGNKSAKLGPRNPMRVAQDLAHEFDMRVAIVDANDYGVWTLGYSRGVDKKLVEKIFSDNPLGQAKEKTPLAIVRKG